MVPQILGNPQNCRRHAIGTQRNKGEALTSKQRGRQAGQSKMKVKLDLQVLGPTIVIITMLVKTAMIIIHNNNE